LLTSILLFSLLGGFFQPGDIVYVKIWRHPDLSDSFIVDIDTVVTFPLVGPIKVASLTPRQLQDSLNVLYSEYIKDPFITVTPMFKISILGEVRRPGVYAVSITDRIFDAIARAGGTTSRANLKKAKIKRGGRTIKINLKKAIESGQRVTDVGLKSGDVIYIPKKLWPQWRDWYYFVSTVAIIWSIYRTVK